MKSILNLLLISFIIGIASNTAFAQEASNTWKTLSKITYKKEYDELMGFKVDVPVFSEEIKEMAGKEINIKGYIIPVDGYKSHTEFIFSAFPYNMCFFCGGAGPETVMEVSSVEAVKYTAEQIEIIGKLELNDSDINRLMYILTDVKLVKESIPSIPHSRIRPK